MRLLLLTILLCLTQSALASAKLYVFDCGRIQFGTIQSFGLKDDQTDVRELFVPCYLVEHERGRLLWDAGLPLALAGKEQFELQPGVSGSYKKSLIAQLAELNLKPADVDFIALSHHHFDHAGAANAFAGATVLIQAAEHVAAFERAGENPVFDPALYNQLADSRKVILNGDYDVFGDRSVLIVAAPGHTPGHQVLSLNLANTGPLVLSGDLYHFRKSRELRTTPEFNTNPEQTLRSMDKVEAHIAATGATLWIEHDLALAETLNLAPAYYD